MFDTAAGTPASFIAVAIALIGSELKYAGGPSALIGTSIGW